MPRYGKTLSINDIVKTLSDPDGLQDMAWAISDWVELIDWLELQGAPDKYEDNVTVPTIDKVKWLIREVVENGKVIQG